MFKKTILKWIKPLLREVIVQVVWPYVKEYIDDNVREMTQTGTKRTYKHRPEQMLKEELRQRIHDYYNQLRTG